MIPDVLRSYDTWEQVVPKYISLEDVWKLDAYRKALYVYELSWFDCERMMKDLRGRRIVSQLISSIGSISANLEEGYGRGLGTREYHQFLRYAIGSGKEAKGWYFRSRHLLTEAIIEHRLKLLSEILALTIFELTKQRKRKK